MFEAVYTHTNDPRGPTPSQSAGYVSMETLHMISAAAQNNPELRELIELMKQPQGEQSQRDEYASRLTAILRVVFPNGVPEPSTAPASSSRPSAWDLVIEFREKPLDKWIFPRGTVHREKTYNTSRGGRVDARVVSILPYIQSQINPQAPRQQDTPSASNGAQVSPQPVTFHLRGITEQMYQLLTRWSLTSLPSDVLDSRVGLVPYFGATY